MLIVGESFIYLSSKAKSMAALSGFCNVPMLAATLAVNCCRPPSTHDARTVAIPCLMLQYDTVRSNKIDDAGGADPAVCRPVTVLVLIGFCKS